MFYDAHDCTSCGPSQSLQIKCDGCDRERGLNNLCTPNQGALQAVMTVTERMHESTLWVGNKSAPVSASYHSFIFTYNHLFFVRQKFIFFL